MNLNPQEARDLVGRPLHDSRGEQLGEVSGVYFSDAGGQLDWLSVAVPTANQAGSEHPDPSAAPDEPASGPGSDDSRRTSDSENESGLQQRFVPAGALTRGADDRLALPFGNDLLANQPHIEPRDGALSNVQVARLHEFFQTFDGHSRITTASQGEPLAEAGSDSEVPFTGRVHEATFGTGAPGPGEPHDVTLQGTGNPAP